MQVVRERLLQPASDLCGSFRSPNLVDGTFRLEIGLFPITAECKTLRKGQRETMGVTVSPPKRKAA